MQSMRVSQSKERAAKFVSLTKMVAGQNSVRSNLLRNNRVKNQMLSNSFTLPFVRTERWIGHSTSGA